MRTTTTRRLKHQAPLTIMAIFPQRQALITITLQRRRLLPPTGGTAIITMLRPHHRATTIITKLRRHRRATTIITMLRHHRRPTTIITMLRCRRRSTGIITMLRRRRRSTTIITTLRRRRRSITITTPRRRRRSITITTPQHHRRSTTIVTMLQRRPRCTSTPTRWTLRVISSPMYIFILFFPGKCLIKGSFDGISNLTFPTKMLMASLIVLKNNLPGRIGAMGCSGISIT
uniref:Uncharacterized protein n=1 Tax=Triticum urartu TaxID=4572 RepID=A0A8R7RGV7_TRIUA